MINGKEVIINRTERVGIIPCRSTIGGELNSNAVLICCHINDSYILLDYIINYGNIEILK